ncbi:hypothetical protein RRG08_031950 [Elysia crispata]|uniref:Uncharacterized protein n=1 Tax=Elysia crispata TaxID=231223 RepID=A0AAE0Z4Y5_9GAST|nr:hypothetical protein RRG08_031950 [Elysia crispata]
MEGVLTTHPNQQYFLTANCFRSRLLFQKVIRSGSGKLYVCDVALEVVIAPLATRNCVIFQDVFVQVLVTHVDSNDKLCSRDRQSRGWPCLTEILRHLYGTSQTP